MGRLVVIEGLDGAGKNTLAGALTSAAEEQGAKVARMTFPRYTEDIHAELIGDALHGRLGDVIDSVYAMALLFALDRRAARAELDRLIGENDLVLLDRYVASNAAYSAARLHQGADGEFVGWLRELEIDRFGAHIPDMHLLLDVDVSTAAGRAEKREAEDGARVRDSYESDGGLQSRCGVVYRELAARSWLCPWTIVDGVSTVDSVELAKILLDLGV